MYEKEPNEIETKLFFQNCFKKLDDFHIKLCSHNFPDFLVLQQKCCFACFAIQSQEHSLVRFELLMFFDASAM